MAFKLPKFELYRLYPVEISDEIYFTLSHKTGF
jgi:hypothetical protein